MSFFDLFAPFKQDRQSPRTKQVTHTIEVELSDGLTFTKDAVYRDEILFDDLVLTLHTTPWTTPAKEWASEGVIDDEGSFIPRHRIHRLHHVYSRIEDT